VYADGVEAGGEERGKRLFVLDRDIGAGAERLYRRVITRRIRIRSMALTLGGLKPLGWEPDLFVPEGEDKLRRVQEAADRARGRYGVNAVTKGMVLAGGGKFQKRRIYT
jgi:DNA polymerase-4